MKLRPLREIAPQDKDVYCMLLPPTFVIDTELREERRGLSDARIIALGLADGGAIRQRRDDL